MTPSAGCGRRFFSRPLFLPPLLGDGDDVAAAHGAGAIGTANIFDFADFLTTAAKVAIAKRAADTNERIHVNTSDRNFPLLGKGTDL